MKPQYITDGSGRKLAVILSVKEFEKMMEELEELNDIRLYDLGKKSKREGIPANLAFKQIETRRKTRS